MSASCIQGERSCVSPAVRDAMGCDVHRPAAGRVSGLTHTEGIKYVVLDVIDSLV